MYPDGVEITGEMQPGFDEILSTDALNLIAGLARTFTARRNDLLEKRRERQQEINAGKLPDFLAETAEIRAGDWKVASLPEDILDRRVEITGPTSRKMVINALNSGASVFMADFEDANAPTWSNMVQGQINLRDAVNRTINFTNEAGRLYQLNDSPAVLFVRPRGWHLDERHILVDGQPVPGGVVDFALYLFHNAEELKKRGSGPYYYLPKLENHLEARLWNDIFIAAQNALNIPIGTVKATVLVETILATFELDEILYELREHSAGLNCGRWDYIFSYIKKFQKHPNFVLPDRSQVTMTQHMMHSYSRLVIKTCHKRGVHAMGGMAAQIPIKNDPAANEDALEKVRKDKLREAQDGHDGTWVAHPALVSIAKSIFDEYMPTPNQIDTVSLSDFEVTAKDLLQLPEGEVTEHGLRWNLKVGIQYLEAWLGGNGCVPLYFLMEDAATAEISRAQVWQWLHHQVKLDDGHVITKDIFAQFLAEEMEAIKTEVGVERFAAGNFELARKLFEDMILSPELEEFLTIPAYDHI